MGLKIFFAIFLALLISSRVYADDVEAVKVDVLAKSGSSRDGETLPEYAVGKPEITILKITIPPGAEIPRHKHPVINGGVLLSGELTVITEDDQTLHLKAGESLIEVVDKWHYGKNHGDVAAEIIVFYAGADGTPITVEGNGGLD